jgi:hypothetical protein
MTNEELTEKFEGLQTLYTEIKQEIRKRDKNLFERWKASGFVVDIFCHYPCLREVVDELTYEEEEKDDIQSDS